MRELMAMLAGHGVATLIFIGCLIALLSLLRTASGPPASVAKPFLTRREAAMLRALEQVLPMYRIHAQVAMGALLKAPAGLGRRASFADRNSFSQKIVDFVIHDPTTGKVIALVEVDDYSHDIARDRKRDAMTARRIPDDQDSRLDQADCSRRPCGGRPPARADPGRRLTRRIRRPLWN